jgi:sulfoxide reductase heme-binding subunit YedZ
MTNRISAALPRLKPLVFVVCCLPAVWLAWNTYQVITGAKGSALTDLGANPIRELQIATGLWTIRFLAITLAVTPARQLFDLGPLAKYRRMFGLFTFFYACLHITMWGAVDWFFDWAGMWDEIVKHKYILVGMATFLMLVPLAATSTNWAVRKLGGKRWSNLHKLVYVCGVTATIHYLWAVTSKKGTTFPLVYLGIFLALLGYRVVQLLRRRRAGTGTDRRAGVARAGGTAAG